MGSFSCSKVHLPRKSWDGPKGSALPILRMLSVYTCFGQLRGNWDKKSCPRFASLRTTNSKCSYQQLGQVRPVCMLTSSFSICKDGSAHKKCEVFNILSLHMSHMVSYQGGLLPSCPEPTLLFSVASENETHHTTIAVHDYSHSRETRCMLHTMQMGHLLIRQFPFTSLCRFRMCIM